MSRTSSTYGKFPTMIIEAGLLAELSGGAVKVYLALASHCRKREGFDCFVSAKTLSREAGVSRSTVFTAINRLKELGLVSVFEGGGRGHANQYRLAENHPNSRTVSDSQTVRSQPQNRPVAETKPSDSCRTPIKRKKRINKEASADPHAQVDHGVDTLHRLARLGFESQSLRADLALGENAAAVAARLDELEELTTVRGGVHDPCGWLYDQLVADGLIEPEQRSAEPPGDVEVVLSPVGSEVLT